jgi:hypothetical protein
MKNLIIILLFFSFSLLFSQSRKEILKSDVKSYIKAINTSDFEKQLEYIPSFVFDSISRESLLTEMKKSNSNDESTIELNTIFEIDTIITIDKKQYSRVNISHKITLDLSESKDKGGMDYAVSMTYKSLLKEYGKDNVTFNKESWIFYIVSDVSIYGLKEENWTFTDLNELTESHIPHEIKKN